MNLSNSQVTVEKCATMTRTRASHIKQQVAQRVSSKLKVKHLMENQLI